MKTPILGSSYVARSVNAADSRMVNLYPEMIPEGGKEAAFLNRAPGLRLLATIGEGPIRGVWAFGGYFYAVSGTDLYKSDSTFSYIRIGSVSGTGPVSMADNGVQLFIACNPDGYIYNSKTEAFGPISTTDFPGAVNVGYLDGYFVFNEPNSQKVWVTSLFDGTTINPLDFASAEGSPDNLVALAVDHREAWLFGVNSLEVWFDAGTPDFPLQRIQGAYSEIGCAAPYSVAKLDNSLFWLGSDARGKGIVYRANGYTGTRISTHAVEWQIQRYAKIADATAYTYQQDGHSFYVLNFPSANATWVYDVATQLWHERASFLNGQMIRHRGSCQAYFNDENIVGDYANGNLYTFDLDVYDDNGSIQKWLRSWRALPTGKNNLTRTAQHSLQLDCETGTIAIAATVPTGFVVLTTEDGLMMTTETGDDLTTEESSGSSGGEVIDLLTEDGFLLLTEDGYHIITEQTIDVPNVIVEPQIMLRWSDDGGHTWSNEHWRSMGSVGNYGTRVIWRRLGMTDKLRDRVYEVSGTDPVKIAIMGAELVASSTVS